MQGPTGKNICDVGSCWNIFITMFFITTLLLIFFLIGKRVLHCSNDQAILFTSGISFSSVSIKTYSFLVSIGNRMGLSKI